VLGVGLTGSRDEVLRRAASRLRGDGPPVLGVGLTGSQDEVLRRAASRLRAGRYTRRGFVAVVALALAGCGRDEAGRAPEPDAAVLAGLLRAERAAAAAGGELARQDARHAARLTAALRRRGGRPPVVAPGTGTLLERKQRAVFAYVNALPRLSAPELRVLVMQLAAAEAEHLAALRLRAGAPPVPDAFAGATAP
jgi:hypothetical protein